MKKVSNRPLISVIVPIFNVEKYLRRCIDSIISQTYNNLQIILVDDGSTDRSLEICLEYKRKDNRISVIHQDNAGLSSARNTGISKARGEFIGFVDSDDWVNSNMYECLYYALVKTGSDIAVCGMKKTKEFIEEKPIKINDCDVSVFSQQDYIRRYFKIGFQKTEYYAQNKLYKRSLITLSQYPVGLTSEDVFGTYKAVLKSRRVAYIRKNLYYYYRRTESITGHFSNSDYDLVKIWDLVVDYSRKNAPQYLEYAMINRERIIFTLLFRAAGYYSNGDLKNNSRVNKMVRELKKSERHLLRSNIAFSRKIMIFLFCRNYYFFSNIVRLKNVLA